MRVFDAKSLQWAIRHIYIIMALVGLLMLALIQPVYFAARNPWQAVQGLIGDPNVISIIMYGGDATVLVLSLFAIGLIITAVLAIVYQLIRRGVTVKLRGSKVNSKGAYFFFDMARLLQ